MIDSTSTNDWLRSPGDPPIYSGELIRKVHWLAPVSTWLASTSTEAAAREWERLEEERLYNRSWREWWS